MKRISERSGNPTADLPSDRSVSEDGPSEGVVRQIRDLEIHVAQLSYQAELIQSWSRHALIEVDRDGIIRSLNVYALSSLGRESENLIGKPCHATLHHSLADGVEYPWEFCPIHAAIEDGSVHHADGDVFWRQDGTCFPVDYVCHPLWGAEHEIQGAVITFRDLAEERQRHAQEVHSQKLQSIGALAAGVAHELNTPIQFIGDNLRFLGDSISEIAPVLQQCKSLDPGMSEKEWRQTAAQCRDQAASVDLEYLLNELPQAIEQSLSGIDRVASIVRALKEFSHPGDSEVRPVRLEDLISSTLVVARNEWKYVAEVITDYDPELPVVQCHAQDLSQVILNLIVNAAHAIAEKARNESEGEAAPGRITISTASLADQAEIRIRDTGAGVKPENIARIFDPFFTTKTVGKGTGQGLALAHSVIVKKHGGTIHCESELGVGTEFVIRLPLVAKVAASSTE